MNGLSKQMRTNSSCVPWNDDPSSREGAICPQAESRIRLASTANWCDHQRLPGKTTSTKCPLVYKGGWDIWAGPSQTISLPYYRWEGGWRGVVNGLKTLWMIKQQHQRPGTLLVSPCLHTFFPFLLLLSAAPPPPPPPHTPPATPFSAPSFVLVPGRGVSNLNTTSQGPAPFTSCCRNKRPID